MSSPILVTAGRRRGGLQIPQTSPPDSTRRFGGSSYTDDRSYDSLEGSSAELTDVFDEESEYCDGGNWSSPVADLKLKVAAQLENYFSNDSLSGDAFLLKHVQRNKMGYVSLKLLTSFKKIRELTHDWRTALAAARTSDDLEVNEEGTKVRRRDPVPTWLLCIPTSKLLLAWNLLGAEEGDTKEEEEQGGKVAVAPRVEVGQQGLMEAAMCLFGSHGAIISLHILRPGKEIPKELRRYTKKHPELGRKVCAVVEYEYLEGARRAYEALQAERDGAGGVRVVVLGSKGTRKAGDGIEEESEDSIESVFCSQKPNRKVKRYPYCSLEDSAHYSSSESDFTPASPRPNRWVSRPPALYGSPLVISAVSSFPCNPYMSPMCSPVETPLLPRKLFPSGLNPSPLAAPELSSSPVGTGANGTFRSKCSGDSLFSLTPSNSSVGSVRSPWVQRRKIAAQAFFPGEKGGPPLSALPKRGGQGGIEVLRQPLGPDGTKGFYNTVGRGRMIEGL